MKKINFHSKAERHQHQRGVWRREDNGELAVVVVFSVEEGAGQMGNEKEVGVL